MSLRPALWLLPLAILFITIGQSRASETVVTLDGMQVTGEVTFDGEVYIVKSATGIETKLPKSLVKEVLLPNTADKMLQERVDALRKSADKDNADAWYQLGMFAEMCNLHDDAAKCHEQAITIDTNHLGARSALGYNLIKGKWLKEAVADDANGEIAKSNGPSGAGTKMLASDSSDAAPPPWATYQADGATPGGPNAQVDKSAKGGAGTPANATQDQKRRAAISKSDHVYINCPDCLGTGYVTWIPCGQCSRSGQPGMVYLGEKYEICPRCNGAAKWPGLKCPRCEGQGKIDPDRNQQGAAPKKEPPKGFRFCTKCDGTGFDVWRPCPKCAKSDVPGKVIVRNNLIICDNCQGIGKFPMHRCDECGSTGVIRTEPKER